MDFLTGQKLVKQKEYGKALGVFLNLLENGIDNKNIYFYTLQFTLFCRGK